MKLDVDFLADNFEAAGSTLFRLGVSVPLGSLTTTTLHPRHYTTLHYTTPYTIHLHIHHDRQNTHNGKPWTDPAQQVPSSPSSDQCSETHLRTCPCQQQSDPRFRPGKCHSFSGVARACSPE